MCFYFLVSLRNPGFVKSQKKCDNDENTLKIPESYKVSVASTINPPTTLSSVNNLPKVDLNDLRSKRESNISEENSRVDVSVGESSYCGEDFDHLPEEPIEDWRSIYFRSKCDVPEKPPPSSPSVDMSFEDTPKRRIRIEEIEIAINEFV